VTTNTSALAISARAVRKSFGDHVALDGVTLSIAEGEHVAIAIKNGGTYLTR